MVFGLFGGGDQIAELTATLSKESFLEELETAYTTFGIVALETPGKSEIYGRTEALAQFIFEQVVKTAVIANVIQTEKDIEAAALLGVVLVQCLGRNAELSKTECRAMQGAVPGVVFPRTLDDTLKDKTSVALSKAVMRYAHRIGQKKFRKNVDVVEQNITQFLTQRKPEYFSSLAADIGRFT